MIKEIGNFLKGMFRSIFYEWKQKHIIRMINKSVIVAADVVSFISLLIAYVFIMIGISMWIGQHFNTKGVGYMITGMFQLVIAVFIRPYIIVYLRRRYVRFFLTSNEEDIKSNPND